MFCHFFFIMFFMFSIAWCVFILFCFSNCLLPFRQHSCNLMFYYHIFTNFDCLWIVVWSFLLHNNVGNRSKCKKICKRFTLQYTNEWHHFERGKTSRRRAKETTFWVWMRKWVKKSRANSCLSHCENLWNI